MTRFMRANSRRQDTCFYPIYHNQNYANVSGWGILWCPMPALKHTKDKNYCRGIWIINVWYRQQMACQHVVVMIYCAQVNNFHNITTSIRSHSGRRITLVSGQYAYREIKYLKWIWLKGWQKNNQSYPHLYWVGTKWGLMNIIHSSVSVWL